VDFYEKRFVFVNVESPALLSVVCMVKKNKKNNQIFVILA